MSKEESPLVTFALFCFNQEAFVKEAVEGALKQDYANLEIIISDDCSTDRTFDVIRETVAGYAGPHVVRLVRNVQNLGLLPHIFSRGREAKGEIVVMAAGDDVSLPTRVTRLVNAFEGDVDVESTFSLVTIIDSRGETIQSVAERPIGLGEPKIYLRRPTNRYSVIQGCSAAYKRSLFDLKGEEFKGCPEDLLFSLYINIRQKRIRRVDQPLVKYRSHERALSNKPLARFTRKEKDDLSVASAREQSQCLDCFLKLASSLNLSDQLNTGALRYDYEFVQDVQAWSTKSFGFRAKSVLCDLVAKRLKAAGWKTLRLFR